MSPRKVIPKNDEDFSITYPTRPEWSPDGGRIAYIHGGDHSMLWYALQEVSVIDLETGDIDFITEGFDRNTYMPQWSERWTKYLFHP